MSALSKLTAKADTYLFDTRTAERLAADLVAVIRAMTLEEVAELRPDLATEFHAARETAAARGAYIIATARARAADGRNVNVRVVVEDVSA